MERLASVSEGQNIGGKVERPDGSTYYTGPDTTKVVKPGDGADEKDMFLKLMIEQLRHQDPFSPMDSTDMMTQLAQLNSVQQLIELNMLFSRFSYNQELLQASSLIGRYVDGYDAAQNFVTGVVEWIEVIDGVITLHLGDQLLLLNQVINIRVTAPDAEEVLIDEGEEIEEGEEVEEGEEIDEGELPEDDEGDLPEDDGGDSS